jgi:PAS domain S-box-containing protein
MSELPRNEIPIRLALASLVIAGAILALDAATPLGVADPMLYIVLVLAGLWSPRPAYSFILAAAATVLAVVGYYLSPPGGIPWIGATNRVFAVFAVWVAAALVCRQKKIDVALRRAHDELESRVAERTAELQRANELLLQDAEELARQSRSLQENEAHLRGVMERVPDGVITSDEHGLIETFNPAAERIFGYAAQEVRGQNVQILMPEPDRSQHAKYIADYLRTGEGRIIGIGPRQAIGRCKDGVAFPIELDVAEMWTGRKRLFVAVVRDITQREETENRLRQAQKMEAVGQLTGGVAHDFNNLLTVILGNLELLAQRGANDPAQHDLVETAARAALRGADLTRRLLAFSRKQPLNPVPTDVNVLVSRMAELFRRTLGDQVQVDAVTAGGLWPAMVDAAQLENALLNLAINARDAMPAGGRLSIETANAHLDQGYADGNAEVKAGQYVMIAVSDTGVGMAPEVAARAFEPFFTTKETGKGSGLGLSMVYGFVKQSGGHVSIYSEAGHGTAVKLYLPKADAPARHPAAYGPQQALPEGKETVLVVEDNPDVRVLVVASLSSLGYRVFAAEHGPAALALLDTLPALDLLLTDVMLPGGMNGRAVADAVKKRYPQTKILFTSGYTENAIVQQGRLERGTELLAKPYTRQELARTVRRVLDGKDD